MDETLTAKVIHAVVFLAICSLILTVGWKEPIRYRFMSSQEIALIETPPPPPAPTPTPAWIDVRKTPSRLDEPTQRSLGGSTRAPSKSNNSR